MKDSIKKIKANQHESYGSFTLISVLIPLAGLIMGVIFLTKDTALEKKLGEHLLAVSVLASIIGFILLFTVLPSMLYSII